MLNKKKDPVYITKVCLLLLLGALAVSAISTAFTPRAQAQASAQSDELPSFRNMHGIIPNSKNLPRVSLGSFLNNIVETTGIYAFINGTPVEIEATFSDLTANGSESETTTQFILTFDKDIDDLTVGDINLTAGSTGAAGTGLTRTGTGIYELEVSGIRASGTVTVGIARDGYAIGPSSRTVTVYSTLSPIGTTERSSAKIPGWHGLIMVLVGFLIIYLGTAKGFEPLLLIPIGFGTIFANIPLASMGAQGVWDDALKIWEHQGFLNIIYNAGIGNEFFPLIIFIGIGAMTDFGPLIANPKTAILGAAAQFGVFGAMFFVSVANLLPNVAFNLKEACAVSIIGGADGPTTIYIAAKLAPHLMATVAVAAYSYMALVPMIQPPIMKLLTTKKERLIRMRQLRPVSQKEKVLFPIVVFGLALLLIPSAAPLIGCLMFGNFLRECKVVDRLSDTSQNALMNIVSMFLSLGVGSQMTPEKFLNSSSLIIVVMGLIAFCIATATGVCVAKIMNLFLKEKINPLIGSAGVSAVPMAARVSNKVGQEYDPGNFLLMHAMGPNVAGVIGTAIAAGVLIAVYGGH